MLSKFNKNQLVINIGDQKLNFDSVAEIEFALEGRTSVSTEKVIEMMGFSSEHLKGEIDKITEIEEDFQTILLKEIEQPESIERSMRELSPQIFSLDHRWRDIITALNSGGEELTPVRRIVLLKYTQYLSSRKQMLTHLYSQKKEEGKGPFSETINVINEEELDSGSEERKYRKNFERLPKGKPVTITLIPGTELNLFLSTHKCKMKVNGQAIFIDHTGNTFFLKDGRNTVGRDASGTVVIDSKLRDVSRLHLVIENLGGVFQFTDMSSHGTFFPSKYLK